METCGQCFGENRNLPGGSSVKQLICFDPKCTCGLNGEWVCDVCFEFAFVVAIAQKMALI